jgi:hypothetical protein
VFHLSGIGCSSPCLYLVFIAQSIQIQESKKQYENKRLLIKFYGQEENLGATKEYDK